VEIDGSYHYSGNSHTFNELFTYLTSNRDQDPLAMKWKMLIAEESAISRLSRSFDKT
jgi:hypothetical protein